MAARPVFIANTKNLSVEKKEIEFKWFPGFSVSQKQKSIESLHENANKKGIDKILEISSKSPDELGVKLSAFNLMIHLKSGKKSFSVESAFQGSKVFTGGGPYTDLYMKSSREAKKDSRIKESGNLVGFNYFGREFPLEPKTFFYDWLYINALTLNKELADEVVNYSGFTDIEFNPEKSINCQAFSAALFVILKNNNILDKAFESHLEFIRHLKEVYRNTITFSAIQTHLF